MDATALPHEGCDQPQIRVSDKRCVHGQNVWVRTQPHRLNFQPDFRQVRVDVIQIQHLDGTFLLTATGLFRSIRCRCRVGRLFSIVAGLSGCVFFGRSASTAPS